MNGSLNDVASRERQHDRPVVNRPVEQKAQGEKQAGKRDLCPAKRPLHPLGDHEHESFLRCRAHLCAHVQPDAAADAQVAKRHGQERRQRADAGHQGVNRADQVDKDRDQHHHGNGAHRNVAAIHEKDDADKGEVNRKHPEADGYAEVLKQGNKQRVIRAEAKRGNRRHHVDAERKNQQTCDKQDVFEFEAKHEQHDSFHLPLATG